ncbi:hypothetical protein [Paenibacillus piscarius]|uniref:hypothetical protein n=1 Tax=Paenibacillus piscarius TaxID=1089681 RepID=UPI001EE81885|nr:hypothetical protein [Paenibacillus piscarius]
MNRKRTVSILNLFFLIPVIILSFYTWKDYKKYLTNVKDYFPAMEQIFLLDGGKQILGLSKEETFDEKYDVYVWDTATAALIRQTTIPTSFQSEPGPVTYQQDGILIPIYTKTSGLMLNLFRPTGEIEELSQGTLHIPFSLSSNAFSWRGRLIAAGNITDSEWVIAQVKDGKLERVILDKQKLLPARPVRMSELIGSFQNELSVPLFSVSLKDNRSALVSGILDTAGKPAVLVGQKDEASFALQDRASAQFAKVFGFNNAKLVRVHDDYPGIAAFYNRNEKEWGAAVPVPKPVYQARVFLLNDDEVLIAGSTAEDEVEGQVTGYIFNERTGQFQDASSLLKQLAYDHIKATDTRFYKQSGSSTLYYSSGKQEVGAADLEIGKANVYTNQQVEGWLITDKDTRVSPVSFLNYAKQGGGLVINWVVWVMITLLLLLSMAIFPRMLINKRSKHLRSGQIVHGRIKSMQETGLYVNEQPMVRFVVEFEDEGRLKEVEIKQVISFLTPLKVGDSVRISYNRKKHKALFLTEEDLRQL